MLEVKIKVIGEKEYSVDLADDATVSDLRREISILLSCSPGQLRIMKSTGGVISSSQSNTPVKDIYNYPQQLKVILIKQSDNCQSETKVPKIEDEMIEITVKFLDKLSENIRLSVSSDECILKLKTLVSNSISLPSQELIFLYKGLSLSKDSKTLREYGIVNDSTITVKSTKSIVSKLQLKISILHGDKFTLTMLETATISELRGIISARTNQPANSIKLLKSGRALAIDSKSLNDYEVANGNTIQVVINTQQKPRLSNDVISKPETDSTAAEKMDTEPVTSETQVNHNQMMTSSDLNSQIEIDSDTFLSELDTALKRHIPNDDDRRRVIYSFASKTHEYVYSLNLDDIEQIAKGQFPDRS